MNDYVPVLPGVNLSKHLRENSRNGRITKAWVMQVMASHPEWDWRNLGFGGTYLNGATALRMNLTLQVMDHDGATTRAMVTFRPDEDAEYGYQAVVS